MKRTMRRGRDVRRPDLMSIPVLAAILLAAPISAQEGAADREGANGRDRTARAVRIERAPSIDGVLDEDFWATLPPITDFVQREPVDGGTPTERTEVRIAYDDRALYFGFTLYDSEPDRIRRSILHREGRIDQDDRVIIALDTYDDDRNGYIFELNAFGTQGDALFSDERNVLSDWNWEGVYYSEGRVTEEGWVLEVAIPFTTIRFARTQAPRMGIALYRSIRRKNEEVYWPHIPQRFRGGIAQASQYAVLDGLAGVKPGRNIQVIPFAVAGAQKTRGTNGTTTLEDIGIDAKYSITPNLTLDLTWNTDFAQVEADNVQINLTRFNLFFPEKRPFFLERANLFALGDTRETEVFFSRRIGLVNEIVGGGRLTGQAGPLSLGLLSLQTDDGLVVAGADTTRIQGANNTVVRVQGEVLPRTTVGAVLTNVQNSAHWDRTFGADVTARFWGSSIVRGWVAETMAQEGPGGGTGASSFTLEVRPTRLWQLEAGYTDIGEEFRPALGFVRRRDMVRTKAGAAIVPRFDGSRWARQLVLAVNGSYIEGQDGRKQSVDGLFHSMLGFQSGDNISLNVNHDAEVLNGPFAIRSDAAIPGGSYDWRTVTASARFNESRRYSGNARIAFGGFYHGDRVQLGGQFNWKTGPHLTLSGSVDHNDISLPLENGEFATTILGLNMLGAVSRALFANALVQYDTDSKTLRSNVRINWIHRPGSNLYLVFDTGYDLREQLDDPRLSRWTRRTGVVKLTWLQAF